MPKKTKTVPRPIVLLVRRKEIVRVDRKETVRPVKAVRRMARAVRDRRPVVVISVRQDAARVTGVTGGLAVGGGHREKGKIGAARLREATSCET